MATRPEQAIHKAVADHLRSRAHPAVFWWHTPSGVSIGGKRNKKGVPIQAMIMKGLGWREGVPDIIAIYRGKCFALELKAPNGRPTEAQLEAIWSLERAGAYTCIAYGLDAALKALEQWGILRGKVT